MQKSGNNILDKTIIVIAGPTASGKTSLAVSLAENLNCSVVSADSRQFYKELSIGTAKPTPEEIREVPHYFVDSHSITTPLSAGQFEKEALEVVEALFQKDDFVIVVGGSGMFINALIYGTDQIPHDPEVREYWNQEYQEKGIEFLQKKLKEVDLEYFKSADIQNPMRLIRALEVYKLTGVPYSTLRKEQKKTARYNTHFFVIDYPREELYDRINQRVDIMVENGLINEVKDNLKYRDSQALNTVGYKEIFEYLDGNINKEEAINLVKQNSRRYAKRQLTWFRKQEEACWLKPKPVEEQVKFILELIKG